MENVGQYITKYVKGKVPKLLFENPSDETLPYLTPDYLRGKAKPEFYAEPSKRIVEVDDGEVIVLWDGSNAGEIFISKKGILGSTMVKLEFDENEIYKPYFSYSFQYLEYFLKAKTAGSGIPHADKGVIKKLDFFKPPKPEQTAIATLLSKVDEAIAATQNSIKAAEKLKTALMQNLLTGKLKPDGTCLTDDEFYEDEKFGKVPKGWILGKVKKVIKLKNGKANATSNLKNEPDTEYNIPVFGGNGITGYYHTPLLTEPTLIIGRVGEYCGNVFLTPTQSWVTDNAMLVDKFLIEDYSLEFFKYKFNTLNFIYYSDTTGQPKLTQGSIGSISFIYPESKIEQTEIAEKINSVELNITEKQTKIQTLQRLKKSLMQNLLTGKVRLPQEFIAQFEEAVEEVNKTVTAG
jgi:type I restriction enzyme S subunit